MYGSFEQAVLDVYRGIVGEAGEDSIKKDEAFGLAADRLAEMVAAGALEVPARAAIMAQLEKADKHDKGSVDRALTALSAGIDPLAYDEDPLLDFVCTVGDGIRKSFRWISADDMREMDTLRYRNLRSAQDGYDRWRRLYDGWTPCLRRHGTVGAAFSAGDVPEFDS